MHLVCLGSHFYLCFILVVELKRYGAQLHIAPTLLAARPGWQVTQEKANDKGAMRLKFDGGWVSCAFFWLCAGVRRGVAQRGTAPASGSVSRAHMLPDYR